MVEGAQRKWGEVATTLEHKQKGTYRTCRTPQPQPLPSAEEGDGGGSEVRERTEVLKDNYSASLLLGKEGSTPPSRVVPQTRKEGRDGKGRTVGKGT